jgi:hypothetical protein
MGVFPGLCALYLVQDLVALVDAGSKLLLASKPAASSRSRITLPSLKCSSGVK